MASTTPLRSIATRILSRTSTFVGTGCTTRACTTSRVSNTSVTAAAAMGCSVVNCVRSFSTDLIPGVGKGKTSTGLVGLAVDHDAPQKIIDKNQALLNKMAASDMPEDAQYRITVTQIANYRIAAAKEHYDNPEMIEELCNCGQVEELVTQADNEMEVLDMYLRGRYWEYIKEIDIDTTPSDPATESEGTEWDTDIEKTAKA